MCPTEGQPAIHVLLTMAFSCELELGGHATLKSLHRKASARKRRNGSMEVKHVQESLPRHSVTSCDYSQAAEL